MSICDLTLNELSEKLSSREVSSAQATEACLRRIRGHAALNTFLAIDEQGALASAEAADRRASEGKRIGALDGVPVALKDMMVTEGIATTAGSQILKGWIPPYRGTMARRLADAGAVVIGKTNQDEFAMGSSTEWSSYGPVANPWDRTRVPGGSSGGSAAAVAAGQVFGALGTDTGGSIRQPASLCGVYGLKPTYGRVSRFGVIAFASSLDQVGPFGRSARDVAHLLQAIAGHDPRDSTSAQEPVPSYLETIDAGVAGLKVGVPEEFFAQGLSPDVERAVRAAIEKLRELGAEIVPIALPHTKYAVATYYVICTAEASSNLARYDGVRYGPRSNEKELRRMYAASRYFGFGPEVRRRIILGTYVLSAGYYDQYYGRAQRVRTLIRRDFEEAFRKVDCIATPVYPTPAFTQGEKLEDPLAMYLADIYTVSTNLSGHCGLSVPAGFSQEGLPIGLQLLGRHFGEATLLRVAQAFERATDHAKKRAPISDPPA
jgi:aspartyl-tRNA(Asn)/glutamyl-tRNA(Gln) amidotransferase subunit A